VDFGVAGSEGSKPIELLQLMQQADGALQETKRNGRRVAV
jgi:hypothetical protein